MGDSLTDAKTVDAFIAKWRESGGAENANFQPFASALTQLLGVDDGRYVM